MFRLQSKPLTYPARCSGKRISTLCWQTKGEARTIVTKMTETLSLMMDDIENDDNGENTVLNYFHNLLILLINVIQEAIYAAYNFNLHS